MNRKEFAVRGIKIVRYWVLDNLYSHIVYYYGMRCHPGKCQEDGFSTWYKAEKHAEKFLKSVKPGFRLPIKSLFPRIK